MEEGLSLIHIFRNKVGGAHQICERDELGNLPAHIRQQILHITDAHHRVDILMEDRYPGAAVFHGCLHHFFD